MLIVTVAGLGMNVGMMALIIATALILLRTVDEAKAIQRMPWGVILMVTGVTVLVVDDAGDAGARADHERDRECLDAGDRSSPSWRSAPASSRSTAARLASCCRRSCRWFRSWRSGLAASIPLNIAWSMNVSASLVDLSSLSTVGALYIAGAAPGTDVKALFNGLLVWGLSMSVVGAVLCWILFG